MDICTASTNPTGCGHYDVTIAGRLYHVHESELAEPLTALEIEQRNLLLMRTLYQTGVSLAQFVGRVIRGEEATNVKQYPLMATGSQPVTKTNIGTTFVDVLPGANGQRSLIDFTGCTQFRLVVSGTFPGTGPHRIRVIRDSDAAVLYESPNIAAQAGERELDSADDPTAVDGWLTLPAQAAGIGVVRFQARSVTASDDPVFRRCILLVR